MDTTSPTPQHIGQRPVPQPADRTFRFGRAAFLAGVGATAGALVLGKHIGNPVASLGLSAGTSVNGFTIYTVIRGYPSFDPHTFALNIGGMVDNPISLSLNDILQHPAVTENRYYQCVTGWSVPNCVWTGIRLSDLLDRVRPHAAAHAVKFYSFDGIYTESLSMEQARHPDVLVAYKLQNKPLARSQGAPIRLVVPGMYGYKFIKWLNRIELVPQPIDGYWELNGYDRDAYIGRSNGA